MDNIQDWIDKLRSTQKLIIVEGKKDKKALSELQIKNIITLNKPLYEIVEFVAENGKECILLLDLDKEGKKLYSRLKSSLQKHGVKIDDRFREFLFKHTKLSNIEGLTRYLEHEKY